MKIEKCRHSKRTSRGGKWKCRFSSPQWYCSYFLLHQFHRLELNDIVYIYHERIKCTYRIDEIYDVKKDGSVEISRDLNQNTLTLITCKKDTNDRQLVVVSYLVNKEEY